MDKKEIKNVVILSFILIIFIYFAYISFIKIPVKQTEFLKRSTGSSYLNTQDDLKQESILTHLLENFNYESKYSLILDNTDRIFSNNNILKIEFEKPVNLTQWQKNGVFSGWLNVKNPENILGVRLLLHDVKGYRSYTELENIPGSSNKIKENNPLKIDYSLPAQEEGLNKWMDFQIVNGDNYLFWRADNFTGNVDMSKITGYEIQLRLASDFNNDAIFKNFRISDGVQTKLNSTGGNWHSPNGMPMYGVFDANDNSLQLLNVRQSQYVSNGDHSRIISNLKTPDNFTERIKFSIKRTSEDLTNTYIRFLWDFEDKYDPGHDDSMAYISLQYNYFGLQRVLPIERYFQQIFEPQKNDTKGKTSFEIKDNQIYEINITTIGQKTKAVLYSVNKEKLYKEAEVFYDFNIERSKFHYPIGIESTGNVRLNLYNIEVLQIPEETEI